MPLSNEPSIQIDVGSQPAVTSQDLHLKMSRSLAWLSYDNGIVIVYHCIVIAQFGRYERIGRTVREVSTATLTPTVYEVGKTSQKPPVQKCILMKTARTQVL